METHVMDLPPNSAMDDASLSNLATPAPAVSAAKSPAAAGRTGMMRKLRGKLGIALPVLAVLIAGTAWLFFAGKLPWATATDKAAAAAGSSGASKGDLFKAVTLVKETPDSIAVPEDVQRALGLIRCGVSQAAVAARPSRKQSLVMPGSTALDPAHLIRVRVRFAPVEVVEIGKIDDPHASPGNVPPARRDLQAGDPVKKGDLLAVLYSVDLGNKKNDLFDALSQLRLDEELLKRAELHSADVPEVFLLNAKRNVQADVNAVSRAENTLKTWAIPDEEIQAVRDEVKKYATDQDRRAGEKDRLKQWARVELKAPVDGFIIEQNVALHETIVDNTTNLIQIAKVDSLIVLAAVPEDDLPALQDLKTETKNQIEWTVQTVGSKPMIGYVDDIGYLIDPNQHTAVVRGHIPNPDGVLRAGQFVTATVDLLPPKNVVEIPISALVEDGKDSIVFVQSDPHKAVYTMRRVEVVNRFDATAYVRSAPLSKLEQRMAGEDGRPVSRAEPLREGERVITAGALELKTALENKESENVKAGEVAGAP
jgi:membrane fusion protein, heavy metal efflux system